MMVLFFAVLLIFFLPEHQHFGFINKKASASVGLPSPKPPRPPFRTF